MLIFKKLNLIFNISKFFNLFGFGKKNKSQKKDFTEKNIKIKKHSTKKLKKLNESVLEVSGPKYKSIIKNNILPYPKKKIS